MGEAATKDELLDKRKQSIDSFVSSFDMQTHAVSGTPAPGEKTPPRLVDEPREKRLGVKKKKRPNQPHVKAESPDIQRALKKSRVQKTLRFNPMLIIEYEQMCDRLDIEPEFNRHMNEALKLWVDRQKRTA